MCAPLLLVSNWFGNNANMEMCAICACGACLAMAKPSFMSFAGLMEGLSWLGQCGHGGVSMGIYYSRHNYAVGRFVSQSIRTQLFIRLPVIALRWRHASHAHYTCTTITHTHSHIYMPESTNRHRYTHICTLSPAIYHYENKRKLQEKKWRDDNCSLLSFSDSFVQ